MRLSIWALVAVLGLASLCCAQDNPRCATECLNLHLESSACDATDAECICADQTLMAAVSSCSVVECTVIEGLAARNATATLCNEPRRDRSLVSPIATIVSGALALCFVLVRIYVCATQRQWTWPDACAFAATLSSIPMEAGEFLMKAHGFGKDIWTLREEEITNVVKYTWVTQVAYIPAIIFTKMAILGIYLRVFPGETFRKFCIGTLIYCILFMVSTFIAALLACVPVEYAWSNWTGTGHGVCFDNSAFWWAHSAINIATDLWIIGLPIPQLLRLQLGMRKKIYLVLMFGVGIVITVVSIIRFSGLLQYSTTTNPTYNNVMVATYSVVECNVSIVCCCMPAALTILRRAFPELFLSTRGQSDQVESGGLRTIGGGGRRGLRNPFASGGGGIQKSVTNTVTYTERCDGSDVVELIDIEGTRVDKTL